MFLLMILIMTHKVVLWSHGGWFLINLYLKGPFFFYLKQYPIGKT